EVRGHRRLRPVEVEEDPPAELGLALLSLEIREREAEVLQARIAGDVSEREIEHPEVADRGAAFDARASIGAEDVPLQPDHGPVPGERADVPAQRRQRDRIGSRGEIEAPAEIEVERSV